MSFETQHATASLPKVGEREPIEGPCKHCERRTVWKYVDLSYAGIHTYPGAWQCAICGRLCLAEWIVEQRVEQHAEHLRSRMPISIVSSDSMVWMADGVAVYQRNEQPVDLAVHTWTPPNRVCSRLRAEMGGPLRAPHHACSAEALIREVALAAGGVLLLGEAERQGVLALRRSMDVWADMHPKARPVLVMSFLSDPKPDMFRTLRMVAPWMNRAAGTQESTNPGQPLIDYLDHLDRSTA